MSQSVAEALNVASGYLKPYPCNATREGDGARDQRPTFVVVAITLDQGLATGGGRMARGRPTGV